VRIANILQRQFVEDLVGIHAARLRLVFTAAYALLRAGRISLTSIGRAIAVQTSHKHGIKRVDRLLGNERLWTERVVFFRAIARRVISTGSRPIVIVDWTSFNPKIWSLVAAVSFEGRAVIIYSEAHPISRYLKPAIHRRFLHRLRDVLPRGCAPIVVTDAGFRSPWMEQVVALGWDYVCRLRGLARLRESGTFLWRSLRSLFPSVGRGATDFGVHELGLRKRYRARVVGFASSPPKYRHGRHWPEKWGDLGRSRLNKQLRCAQEPWMLATSLQSDPESVIKHYRRRMQIEETFRDAKDPRFGLAMTHAHTKSAHRVDILMLLVSFAHLLSILAGFIAEACNAHRRYQANTVHSRRVFSLSRLGRLILASADSQLISHRSLSAAWTLFDPVSNVSPSPA
jgi:hypothetical protein